MNFLGPKTYQPAGCLVPINPTEHGRRQTWECERCGTLVADKTQHDYFHIRLEQGIGPFS